MMICKRLAQVPMLCVPIYNMKLAMMQKTLIFTTFSAHTKMAADKRGQIEVFARNYTMAKSPHPAWMQCPIPSPSGNQEHLLTVAQMHASLIQEQRFPVETWDES